MLKMQVFQVKHLKLPNFNKWPLKWKKEGINLVNNLIENQEDKPLNSAIKKLNKFFLTKSLDPDFTDNELEDFVKRAILSRF